MNMAVYDLPREHILAYLEAEGWHLVNSNQRWDLFEGEEDMDGKPFEIALPKTSNSLEYARYLDQTIEILSGLTAKSPEETVRNILDYDRDVLLVRVLLDNISLPFDLATEYVARLRQLIRFAASSESNAKPYFDQALATASKMMKHYRFGHTFPGSFGYRIEAPVGEKKRFHSEPQQLGLPLTDENLILPLQRRVMERIARGLIATNKAAKKDDVQLLVDGYAEGFNANMCDAILGMAEKGNESIEYNIKWSRKIQMSADVKRAKHIQIRPEHVTYLKSASRQLKALTPELKEIEGRVIGLSSQGDPQSDDVFERSIIVSWERGRSRSRKVRINLNKKDYLKAHQAHVDWNTVAVTGILQKKGGNWQLSDPQGFEILR